MNAQTIVKARWGRLHRAFFCFALGAGAVGGLRADARQAPPGGNSTIWVAANVIHTDGHLVSNLAAPNFEIEDNGAKRDITTFRNDAIPIAVAIMVDISGSMAGNYSLVRRAVSALTTHFQPGDRAIIGAFNSLPWINSRFSARPEALQQSLVAALGGTLDLCDGDWIDRSRLAVRSEASKRSFGSVNEFSRRLAQPGGSAIWDGAACGVNAVASDGETPRRIVILVTDGVDNMSFGPMAGVISRANQYGVMIYAVSVMGGYGMAGADLKSLATSTGGGYFYLTGEDQVADAFTRIGDEMRHQYIFGFASNGPLEGPHSIVVKSRAPETTVRFRRVLMESPGVRPFGAPPALAGTPSPAAALPKSLSLAGRPAPPPPAPVDVVTAPRVTRKPFWDTLDRFAMPIWPTGVAPRMRIEELRSMLATLRRDGMTWINAVPAAEQQHRRFTASAFVLDLLYTQNDPYLWLKGQPIPDLLDWAAGLLQDGSPRPEERLWYMGAIALIERGGVPDLLERFAVRALGRFPDEGRFALARGVAQDLRTWPEERDLRTLTVNPSITSALVSRYEEAMLLPSVRTEASLRLAYFDLRRGRVDAAVSRFASISEEPDDPILRFWLHLLKGRALEQAGRLPEAIAQFHLALEVVPEASSARSGLIAVLAKAKRPAEAARVAARALATPAADVDPWTMYTLPDVRFWAAINAQLSTAVRR